MTLINASVPSRDLQSSPTRRSSDLARVSLSYHYDLCACALTNDFCRDPGRFFTQRNDRYLLELNLGQHVDGNIVRFSMESDRKCTRLNSSHSQNAYAVFGLKKKNEE